MRLHVLSDLHLEFGPFEIPETGTDVLVLAGDIHSHTHGLEWAASAAHGRPVIYVPGNHEYYHSHLSGLSREMQKRADALGVHLLDNGEIVIGDVRFLGTTLWTDFALYGRGSATLHAMQLANSCMADFKVIRYGSGRVFTALDSARLHRAAVQWLADKLMSAHSGPTVVVSHHCPHPRSIPEQFTDDALNPAFCSDLTALIQQYQPELWLHGHTHHSFDYTVGATRIICNPRGYVGHELNTGFLPDLVVESARDRTLPMDCSPRMTDTRFLYLDFDGPLHHHDVYLIKNRPVCREGELFTHCSLLIPVLQDFPDVRIVLSTSWVRVKGFDRAKKRLPAEIQERVVGATWHKAMRGAAWNSGMEAIRAGGEYAFTLLSRYEQIFRDTQRRRAVRWLALDDDDEGWPDNERHRLVCCDPVLGLAQPGKMEELRVRLETL